MSKKKSDAEHGAAGGDIPGGGALEGPGGGPSFGDILTATPEEIQAWLDARLATAPDDVKNFIEAVDYVEPGSLHQPGFEYFVQLGMYTGDRDTVEIAFKVNPGLEAPLDLFLKLL